MTRESDKGADSQASKEEPIIIPVIQEQLTVGKQVIDTAKVTIRKHVTEETTSVNMPLVQEGYRVERVPVNKVVDTVPEVRHEGDNIIIPVLREVVVVQKKYEIIEEVHVIKEKTTTQHQQDIALKKEEITIQRTPLQKDNQQKS
jgi:uncharacterized protein (TIGR02271 family)